MTPPSELLDFPHKGTAAQFDAFAVAVGELYLMSNEPFGGLTMTRIRDKKVLSFKTAMHWATKDLRNPEQLLAIKALIFP
jgi:hypothetical protein